MTKEGKRGKNLTEQSHDDYRGNDTHETIPVVDVEHSINLLVCAVSDRRRCHELEVGEVPL